MPKDKLRVRRRVYSMRRSERLRAAGGGRVYGRWRRICERDDWRCWVCGGQIDPTLEQGHRLAGCADHVVPLVEGGTDADDNVRAAHWVCNARRGSLDRLAPPRGVTV
jgi:5-methylcytosine-specific restriction endonuclease McrA